MTEKPTNIAVSIRDRLLELSRQRSESFQILLTRYGLERFLYRLGRSQYVDRFVLKGAMLFATWTDVVHRPTKDLDLLGYVDASEETLKEIFRNICNTKVELDGIEFDDDNISVQDIRESQEYHGLRVKLHGTLVKAKITLQIDVGFGDVITPQAREIDYPSLLNLQQPRIHAYPKESVVSEKLQAMVALGMINSRMNDFFDLWTLSKRKPFKGDILAKAIKATFKRRQTDIPEHTPLALSKAFGEDMEKTVQWRAFLKRIGAEDIKMELVEVLDDLRAFLEPPMRAAREGGRFREFWMDGKWRPE